MDLFAWKDGYATGYTPIDNQHRYFLALINKLISYRDRDRVVLGSLLEEVVLYAVFHFRSEENGMLVHGYETKVAEQHIKDHGALLRQVRVMADRYSQDDITLQEVILFLLKWFSVHTTEEDRPLGAFLAGCKTNAWQTHELPMRFGKPGDVG